MSKGLTNREIARALGVSASTIKFHVSCILVRLQVSNRAEAAGRAAELPCAHQLPPDPGDFVGRQDVLARIWSAWSRPDVSGVLICGLGGVGKTTLALRAARRLPQPLIGGEIYLDLRATDRALSPSEAMLYVIRSLYPDWQPPRGFAALIGTYRSVLRERPALIFLDDAAGAEQLEPLLPPPGARLIATSRYHFELPDMVSIKLERLTRSESRELTFRLAPRAQPKADEIAELCGDLPLAVTLAGRAIARRPELEPARYVARLRAESERLAILDLTPSRRGVQSSIGLSHRMLPELLASRLAALSVFPADFDLRAAAAIWQADPDSTGNDLGHLLDCSLVDGCPSSLDRARYRLHDLVRLFLRSRIDPRRQRELQALHAAHYSERLTETYRSYRGGSPIAAALARVDAEWENIRLGFQTCVDERQALVARYSAAGTLLRFRLDPPELLRWCRAALDALPSSSPTEDRVELLAQLGSALLGVGQMQHAVRVLEEARALAGDTLDDAVCAGLEIDIGRAHTRLGDPRRAVELIASGLARARRIGDRRCECTALIILGIATYNLGEDAPSAELLTRARALARKLADRRAESVALCNLAAAHIMFGRPARAVPALSDALVLTRELGDRLDEARILGNLGIAERARGNNDAALVQYEHCLTIARELGDPMVEANTLMCLANVYMDVGKSELAEQLLEQRLAIARRMGDRRGEALARWNLGCVYRKRGELERALTLMRRSLDYLREIGHAGLASWTRDVTDLERMLATRTDDGMADSTG